jgi:hypothetical protein
MAAEQTRAEEAALYEVAYEEAARALSEQLSLIDSFRTRAAQIAMLFEIATSLLVIEIFSWIVAISPAV